jgi:hypothetical protein
VARAERGRHGFELFPALEGMLFLPARRRVVDTDFGWAALYERLGFIHVGVLKLPDGAPPLWPMRRPPRS